jgi:hypothetical protein
MASTYTTNLGLRKPEHRDPETFELWHQVLNDNWDAVDDAFGDRHYTGQTYILNSDTHSESLDKIDIALAAMATTVGSLVIEPVKIPRKEVFYPEFSGASFSKPAGGNNTGTMITDSETILIGGLPYRFNFYQWYSGETTLQGYDVILQFRLPDTFTTWNTTTGKAITVDIRTEGGAAANAHVDVEVSMDGSALATTLSDKVTEDGNWKAEKLGTELVGFSRTDPGIFAAVPGSVVNVRVTLNSKDNCSAKLGAITFRYTG